MLNEKEENKYNVIKRLEDGLITRKEASFELSLSLKQIDRLRILYKTEGKKWFHS